MNQYRESLDKSDTAIYRQEIIDEVPAISYRIEVANGDNNKHENG